MAVCWISFRIAKKTVGGKTYDQRYEALENAVQDISSMYWKETTSFIVFETDTAFKSAAKTFKDKIEPGHDLFLMRKMDAKEAIICGKNDDNDIYEMMNYLEKI